MPLISTRINAFFGDVNANLELSRSYAMKNNLVKAKAYCEKAETIISKKLKNAGNSSDTCRNSRVEKLNNLQEAATSSRLFLTNRINNMATTERPVDTVEADRDKNDNTSPIDDSTSLIDAYMCSRGYIDDLKGRLTTLCDHISEASSITNAEVRRAVTMLAGLKHLDSSSSNPSTTSCESLMKDQVSGITFKDLGNLDPSQQFTHEQVIALKGHMLRIKAHVEQL